MNPLPVSLRDVQDAAIRIKSYVRETPLLEAPLLNERLGFRLFVKAECLQFVGAFKARGAFNQILQLTPEEKNRGVVAFSSGNHAQAVAYAAKLFGIHATIVMPEDAPRLKLENTKAYGAKIVTYNRHTENREAIGKKMAEQGGLKLIHSYDAERTIAGQGTVGLEIFQQTEAAGIVPDAIIIPCGGGGFSSGIAVTRDCYKVPPRILIAEPADFNDAQRSLESGELVSNRGDATSICDALLTPTFGNIPFTILRHHGARGLTATDSEVMLAMALAAEHLKLVLEPGGAVALACAALNRKQFQGSNVVVVASGGNIDSEAYVDLIKQARKSQATLL